MASLWPDARAVRPYIGGLKRVTPGNHTKRMSGVGGRGVGADGFEPPTLCL